MLPQSQDEIVTELFNLSKNIKGSLLLFLRLLVPFLDQFPRHSAQHLDVVGVIQRTAHVLKCGKVPVFHFKNQTIRVDLLLDLDVSRL